MGYKAGLTNIVREVDRPGSNVNKKGVVEAVTIVESPPLDDMGQKQLEKGFNSTSVKYCHAIRIIAAHSEASASSAPEGGTLDQRGYHHPTEINKKIYKIGQGYPIKNGKLIKNNSSVVYGPSDKNMNPLGGFVHYRVVTNDFVMLEGGRALKSDLKLTDTTSKFSHGRFQTMEEKKAFVGPLRKESIAKEEVTSISKRYDEKML
ncbi:hypothetical protein U0070_022967 [Myodes glareolus]|uniref:60S ribosomal protein L3 n=1 Tax=Myodes glareolus TaxID=447135 RepID=A0AAW0I870_MYOGA